MITSRQRTYLRKLAQTLPTKYQLGKDGLHEDAYTLLDQGLAKNELIKIHLLKSLPLEKSKLIETLTQQLKADWVTTIGHRVVIYRRHPKEPRIVLPQ